MSFLFDQIKTFFIMLIFGFFSGLLFNIYQLVLAKLRLRKLLIHISDLLFSILLGVFGFLLLIFINYGVLRFYVILAIVIGFSIYYYFFNYSHKLKS